MKPSCICRQLDARLTFFHPSHVPLAIQDAIGDELDWLVEVGVLKKVDHSEWAVPIIHVLKKDGKFRICGDCEVTVNAVLEVDQHPLPLQEEIFASLLSGLKFTKLDLSHAYQQIMLQEDSQKLVTINPLCAKYNIMCLVSNNKIKMAAHRRNSAYYVFVLYDRFLQMSD